MHAAVLGGTGAIGVEVVGQLLKSGKWSRVTTVGRREVTVPEQYKDGKAELVQKVVDMDTLETQAAVFEGVDAVFCSLGTTRKVAGSAEAFIKVDLTYVEKGAEAAKAAGVKHFGLVTAQGANPNIWATNLAFLHPLLYTKTKGLAEEAVKRAGFPSVTILRPGLLDRGEMARSMEKMLAAVGPSVKVQDVAKVMIADAEKALAAVAAGEGPRVTVMENSAIKNAAAAPAATA